MDSLEAREAAGPGKVIKILVRKLGLPFSGNITRYPHTSNKIFSTSYPHCSCKNFNLSRGYHIERKFQFAMWVSSRGSKMLKIDQLCRRTRLDSEGREPREGSRWNRALFLRRPGDLVRVRTARVARHSRSRLPPPPLGSTRNSAHLQPLGLGSCQIAPPERPGSPDPSPGRRKAPVRAGSARGFEPHGPYIFFCLLCIWVCGHRKACASLPRAAP